MNGTWRGHRFRCARSPAAHRLLKSQPDRAEGAEGDRVFEHLVGLGVGDLDLDGMPAGSKGVFARNAPRTPEGSADFRAVDGDSCIVVAALERFGFMPPVTRILCS